jgi:hypothetical protein
MMRLREETILLRVQSLEGLLEQERAAVGALDRAALCRVSEQKLLVLQQVREGLAALGSPPGAALSAACARLLAHAEANAALLEDAWATVAQALGLRELAGTYDARARQRDHVRAAQVKDA